MKLVRDMFSEDTEPVCREPFPYGQWPHVDHRHDCNHERSKGYSPVSTCCQACVRDLLCGPCNHLVGWLEKRSSVLNMALAYLDAGR